MKKSILLLLSVFILTSCQQETKIDAEYVVSKLQENLDKINTLEYRMHRIDTFAQGGTVWNNTGTALIERDKNDRVLGFSFYGKRDDVPDEFIYDAGNAFVISKEDSTCKVMPGNMGFMGSPGGQMIPLNLFHLDSIYNKVKLTENEDTYILKYEFEGDTVYDVTDIVKTIELTKSKFLPVKITRTSIQLGNKSVTESRMSDIKINEDVENSIEGLKSQIKDFAIIQPDKPQESPLLHKELHPISLPDLFDSSNIVDLRFNQPTLIDFWETWCGPCMASFPKVEELKKRYSSELRVVGIVSGDEESARKLVTKKGTTFQNLIGSGQLRQEFGVSSWPRYFLVDKHGIVIKEYFAFSEQIEKDIMEFGGK